MKNGIKLTADDIIGYLKHKQFNSQCTLGVAEFCPYGEGRRLDMFWFNRWNRETRGYEIKVSRADFLADTKWKEYLKFCTRFYFVAPEGIIKPEELPEEIGLMEIILEPAHAKYEWEKYHQDGEGNLFTITHKFKKTAKKLHDVDEREYIQLLEGLLIKLIYNSNIL